MTAEAQGTILLEDPYAPERAIARRVVPDGGVATSSTVARAWTEGGERRHHLLDPATGASAVAPIVAVTVIAATAAWAEAFAKLPFVLGAAGALARFDALDLPALVVGAGGVHAPSAAWGRFAP